MPDPLKYDEVDPTQEQLDVDELRTGKRVLGLAWLISGGTATGETLGLGDLGRIVVDLYKDQRINVPLGFFASWARIHQGSTVKTLPTNGDTELGGFVPFWVPGGGVQTIPVRSKSDVDAEFQMDTNTLDTRFDSNGATLEVAPVYADRIPSQYIPQYKMSTLQFNSGTTLAEKLSEGNYPAVYIREAPGNSNSDIIDRFDITVDNQDQTSKLGLDLSDVVSTILAETESAPEPWKYTDLTDAPPNQGGYRNGQVEVEASTNASGDVQIIAGRRVPGSQVSGVSL